MRSPTKIITFIALLFSLQTPLALNFSASLFTIAVQAETLADRQAEADRLQQQGFEQLQKNRQFQTALESWQKALTIYQEIKDRRGEGRSLGNIGYAYFLLDDEDKAIEYLDRNLADRARDKRPPRGGGCFGKFRNCLLFSG